MAVELRARPKQAGGRVPIMPNMPNTPNMPNMHILAGRRMICTVLLLCASVADSAVNVAGNTATPRLVLFAGPHHTASTSIESFFYDYATGGGADAADAAFAAQEGAGEDAEEDTSNSTTIADDDSTAGAANSNSSSSSNTYDPLQGWIWPRIHGIVANETVVDQPYKIFGQLVTQPKNDVLRNEILQGIRVAWEKPHRDGVILGSEWFDQVATESPYKAVAAMTKITNYVQVHPDDVTVVVNYRTPRFDHWIARWAAYVTPTTATHGGDDDDDDDDDDDSASSSSSAGPSYAAWMCDPKLLMSHVQALATELDPLQAVSAYLEQGWKVQLVDVGGVETAGRDISHVLACDVLPGDCHEGQLTGYETVRPHFNQNAAHMDVTSALTDEERSQAETLFRFRDCAYEPTLRTHQKLEILYNETLWQDCNAPELSKNYENLREEVSYIFKALLSQVKCPNKGHKLPIQQKHMVTMAQALSGNIPKGANHLKTPEQVAAEFKSQTITREPQSAAALLMEFVIFSSILVTALAMQYHRMTQSGVRSGSAPLGPRRVLTVADGVDAEYGNVPGEDDE